MLTVIPMRVSACHWSLIADAITSQTFDQRLIGGSTIHEPIVFTTIILLLQKHYCVQSLSIILYACRVCQSGPVYEQQSTLRKPSGSNNKMIFGSSDFYFCCAAYSVELIMCVRSVCFINTRNTNRCLHSFFHAVNYGTKR